MNGEIFNMDLFIICFSLAAIIYVLTLPYVGKRARESRIVENIQPAFVFESYVVKEKRYDDMIKALDAMYGRGK